MIKVEMTYNEAKFLWGMLKDILSQDAEGRNNGTGGILFNEDVGAAMRLMTPLAQAIDDYNKEYNLEKNPAKPSLTLA